LTSWKLRCSQSTTPQRVRCYYIRRANQIEAFESGDRYTDLQTALAPPVIMAAIDLPVLANEIEAA
jgi:hypothetical protein